MIQLNPDEERFLLPFSQSKNGQLFISFLERRKQLHVASWIANVDEKISSHLRGKVTEDEELIQLIKKLSKIKE